jgi:hypothetical protein
MKLPPFTLVHKMTALERPDEEAADPVAERREMFETVARPEHITFAHELKPNFRNTLVRTSFARAPAGSPADVLLREALPAWEQVIDDLGRRPKVVTVGIWELATQTGYLPWLIEKLNAAQPVFTFFKVQAAIPAGISYTRERLLAWLQEKVGRRLRKRELESLAPNQIVADDFFFRRAERIRKDVGIDYLIGVAPGLVAGEEEGSIFWNYFAVSRARTMLTSAHSLLRYAGAAGRPVEMAVALVAITQLLVVTNPRVMYHPDTGCIFDFNEIHDNIVAVLKKPMIDPDCLKLIQPRYREAAAALVAALGTYTRGDAGAPAPDDSGPAPADT